jgi:hypothetical protein
MDHKRPGHWDWAISICALALFSFSGVASAQDTFTTVVIKRGVPTANGESFFGCDFNLIGSRHALNNKPNSGFSIGGTEVTIGGENLDFVNLVTLGGQPLAIENGTQGITSLKVRTLPNCAGNAFFFTVSSPQAGSAERSRALAFGDLAFQSGRAARQ